jgi:hypothetical protein
MYSTATKSRQRERETDILIIFVAYYLTTEAGVGAT